MVDEQLRVTIDMPADEARALVGNALALTFFSNHAEPKEKKAIQELSEIAFNGVVTLGIPENDLDKFQLMEYITKEALKK